MSQNDFEENGVEQQTLETLQEVSNISVACDGTLAHPKQTFVNFAMDGTVFRTSQRALYGQISRWWLSRVSDGCRGSLAGRQAGSARGLQMAGPALFLTPFYLPRHLHFLWPVLTLVMISSHSVESRYFVMSASKHFSFIHIDCAANTLLTHEDRHGRRSYPHGP